MIIPLNIVMTYPVNWSRFQVLRDFVQNFYDSVGPESFYRRFQYEVEKQVLTMRVDDVSFSYEWLIHIGASTKRSESNQAGYFGEGFKIASLCACRDYGWDVIMNSADWHLHVIAIEHQIDSQNVRMLAYEVEKSETARSSCLRIGGMSDLEINMFKDVINSFYFPENPLLGELLWKGEYGAVYTKGKGAFPDSFPSVYEFGTKGIVFCAYQVLGTNPFNLVICAHHSRQADRERRALYRFDVIHIFNKIAAQVDPKGAEQMLIRMRKYWNSYSKKRIDIDSWSPVIDTLIYRMHFSSEVIADFQRKYPFLLYASKVHTITQQNRRTQARSWLRSSPVHYTVVKDTFSMLGVQSLESKCEEEGGFTLEDDAHTESQINAFLILEKLVDTLFPDFFSAGFPERKIIKNEESALHGMAVCHKKMHPEVLKSMPSLKIRSSISGIYLKQSIFRADGFFDAVSTYIHESCHMFGNDSSQSFSLALTYAMETLLSNPDRVNEAHEQWKKLVSQ